MCIVMASWLVCVGYDSKEREMGEAMVGPHMMFSLFYFGAQVPISHIHFTDDKIIFLTQWLSSYGL